MADGIAFRESFHSRASSRRMCLAATNMAPFYSNPKVDHGQAVKTAELRSD